MPPGRACAMPVIEPESALAKIPCVAIGGITVENCKPVIAAGADFLAVAESLWNYKDGPEAAVRAFDEIFSANRQPQHVLDVPGARRQHDQTVEAPRRAAALR